MRSVVLSIALIAPIGAFGADVDLFNPGSSSVFAVGTLQGESPHLVGEGLAGGLLTSFAQDPVVRSFANGDEVSAVAVLLPVTLYGGYTIAEKARIDLLMPVYPYVDAPIQDFQGAAAGDFRIQGVVPVFTQDGTFAVALVPKIALPTGTANALTRQGFQGGLSVALGGELEGAGIGWLANAGINGSAAEDFGGIGLGSTVDAVAGSYFRATEAFRFGGEFDLKAGLAQGDSGSNTTGGLHIFANNVLDNGVGMTLGAGTGLISGLGSPDYRVFAGISYAQTERDKDRDGIVDKDDTCPAEPEDLDEFEDTDGCPDLDNDGDSIADIEDSCPDEPEDFDGFDDGDGCAELDNDEDQLADADDACPDEFGPNTTQGCPDLDNDGIADKDDTCKTEPGAAETDGCPDADNDLVPDFRDDCKTEPKPADEPAASSNGCPKNVYVTAVGFSFEGKVEFSNGRSTIRSASHALLDKLAALMVANPQAGRVEVQGHTDNTGNADSNLKLSQARADAVRKYLVKKEVPEDRLLAKGYGQTKPTSTNRTEKGRENNRRVAFEFLDAQPTPPAPTPEPAAAPEPEVAAVEALPGVDPNGEPGALSVVVSGGGWANVYVDGTRLTKGAPFSGQPISAGKHKIWIANERLGIDFIKEIEVGNGKTVRIDVPTPEAPEIKAPTEEKDTDDPWAVAEPKNPEPEDTDDPWGVADPKPAPAPTTASPWGDTSPEVEDIPEDEPEEAPATGRFSKKKKK